MDKEGRGGERRGKEKEVGGVDKEGSRGKKKKYGRGGEEK